MRLNTLYIDSDCDFRQKFSRLIRKYGRVVEVDRFDAAKERLLAETFDLVILEINLNDDDCRSGWQLLKTAVKRDFHCIIVTKSNFRKYVRKAYNLGCAHFLIKERFPKDAESLPEV